MRTTIDLDESLLRRLREQALDRGIPFRTLLHRVIQRGLEVADAQAEAPYRMPAAALGKVPEGVNLVKALQLASALEDEEIVRKMAERR